MITCVRVMAVLLEMDKGLDGIILTKEIIVMPAYHEIGPWKG